MIYTRDWAVHCKNPHVRLKAELDQAHQEIALLREQIRILKARMEAIPPSSRPNYPPTERLAILELKAVRGWSLDKTAKAFLVTPATIASWMKRLDEEGSKALVQLPIPVNKFPDLVRYLVQRLKTLCTTLGKAKIAQMLARAGLHLGTTTVSNLLKQKPSHDPFTSAAEPADKTRIVTAKYPNHVWHVDLSVMLTSKFAHIAVFSALPILRSRSGSLGHPPTSFLTELMLLTLFVVRGGRRQGDGRRKEFERFSGDFLPPSGLLLGQQRHNALAHRFVGSV
jgi:hypothetical protein